MTFTVARMITPMASTQKKFEDFGKRMSKQRKNHIDSMSKQIKKIAEEEQKRAKQIFEEHRNFFKDEPETVSIDFYEK
jgi:DNA anti-recombination protein RmuC